MDPSTICSEAARNGDLYQLQQARAAGHPWGQDTCASAAYRGHLEVLKWLRAQDPPCPWNENTCVWAAQCGQLVILQWLREHGCPWDEWTCVSAAYGGHCDLLQWARKEGCPWDVEVCYHATYSGHWHLLQWALQNGCPWDERIHNVTQRTRTEQHQARQWLAQYYEWPWPPKIVSWLEAVTEMVDHRLDLLLCRDLLSLIKRYV